MNVPSDIMHFRNERAKELEMAATAIEQIESGITGPLQQAISFLRDRTKVLPLKDGTIDKTTWGYELNDFAIKIPDSKHLSPKGIGNLSLNLNMRIIGKCDSWQNLDDPLIELSFKVVIRGISDKNYFTGFHLDKHTFETDGEIHPIYHLQYLVNPYNDHEFP